MKRRTDKPLPPQTVTYSPEIEERRPKYQKLAEALITMLHSEHSELEILDVVPPGWLDGEPEPHILLSAIEDHLRALFENLLICYEDDFLRTLYVELRLYYDKQMLDTKAGMFSYRKGGKQ